MTFLLFCFLKFAFIHQWYLATQERYKLFYKTIIVYCGGGVGLSLLHDVHWMRQFPSTFFQRLKDLQENTFQSIHLRIQEYNCSHQMTRLK